MFAYMRDEFDRAWTLNEAALAAARDADFPRREAMALAGLVHTAWMQGDLTRARALGEEAIGPMRTAADPGWLAVFLGDLGTIALLTGDDERGAAWSAEGFGAQSCPRQPLDDRQSPFSDLGLVAQRRGDLVEAARDYAESARLFRAVGDTWYIGSPLAGLAAIAVVRGHSETAAHLLGAAAALRETSGTTGRPTEQTRDEQTVVAARVALGEERYAQALAAGWTLPIDRTWTRPSRWSTIWHARRRPRRNEPWVVAASGHRSNESAWSENRPGPCAGERRDRAGASLFLLRWWPAGACTFVDKRDETGKSGNNSGRSAAICAGISALKLPSSPPLSSSPLNEPSRARHRSHAPRPEVPRPSPERRPQPSVLAGYVALWHRGYRPTPNAVVSGAVAPDTGTGSGVTRPRLSRVLDPRRLRRLTLDSIAVHLVSIPWTPVGSYRYRATAAPVQARRGSP